MRLSYWFFHPTEFEIKHTCMMPPKFSGHFRRTRRRVSLSLVSTSFHFSIISIGATFYLYLKKIKLLNAIISRMIVALIAESEWWSNSCDATSPLCYTNGKYCWVSYSQIMLSLLCLATAWHWIMDGSETIQPEVSVYVNPACPGTDLSHSFLWQLCVLWSKYHQPIHRAELQRTIKLAEV